MGPPLTAWKNASTKNLGGVKSGTPWSRGTALWLCASCVIAFLLVTRGGNSSLGCPLYKKHGWKGITAQRDRRLDVPWRLLFALFFSMPPTVWVRSVMDITSHFHLNQYNWTMCLHYDLLLLYYYIHFNCFFYYYYYSTGNNRLIHTTEFPSEIQSILLLLSFTNYRRGTSGRTA